MIYILILIVIFYLVLFLKNLIFQRFRIVLKSDGDYYVQTNSVVIPFYWHSSMWSDYGRDFRAGDYRFNFGSLEKAKEKLRQIEKDKTKPTIVKIIKDHEELKLSHLAENEEERLFLERIEERISKK